MGNTRPKGNVGWRKPIIPVLDKMRAHEAADTLRKYDQEHGANLCEFIRQYIACDFSMRRAIIGMGYHMNMANYKKNLIVDLTGFDMGIGYDVVELYLEVRHG